METSKDRLNLRESANRLFGSGGRRALAECGLDIVEAGREGSRLFDESGKAYFDCHCSGGQFVLGRKDPDSISALRDAIRECDQGNFFMMSRQKGALGKLLAEIAPEGLSCVTYGVGRGESVDFSLKLARGATGRKEIVAFHGASHGFTGFALSAGADESMERLFGPLIPHVRRVPLDSGALGRAVSNQTAAVLIEPIQSDAGVRFPGNDLLKAARELCDRHGAALVFDEGQTSFGRTGRLFAYEGSGVTPDILLVGKGMGGTVFPITAAVYTPQLNRFLLAHPLIHLSTFGGADVGCVVAKRTIEKILRERLWENAASKGKLLLETLENIVRTHGARFVEARGAGLLCAIQAIDAATARTFVRNLANLGVFAPLAPGDGACVRFTPPIDLNDQDAAEIAAIVQQAAREV